MARLLCLADEFVQSRRWIDADVAFRGAVALDDSPRACLEYGSALAEQERFNESLCQLTAALEIAERDGLRNALATIYHNLAAIYRELDDIGLAQRFQRRAVSLMDDCGPEEMLGLANDAWLDNRGKLAQCLAATAADFDSEERDGPVIEAEATLALMCGHLDDPREGIVPLLRAYEQHQANGDLRLMGKDRLNLSSLLNQLGRYRGEIACVRRAVACFQEAPAPVSAAKSRRILAHLERLQWLRQFNPLCN
ncbi:MAG: tetratricopeptide repeat protein [Planctomycetales bacterium]|nr:tetratricopeptide repeat protein [Planctomycetales bacterium]